MTDELHKISLDDLPPEFAITDSDGNVLVLMTFFETGYVNIDLRGVKVNGANVFELGAEQNGEPRMDGRLTVDVPKSERDVPTFFNVYGDVDTE